MLFSTTVYYCLKFLIQLLSTKQLTTCYKVAAIAWKSGEIIGRHRTILNVTESVK